MDSNYLINRIEDIESVISLVPAALLSEDLSGLVTEVLIYVRQLIDVERLNRTLLAKENIDISTLNEVANIIEDLNLEDPSYEFPGRELNPSSLLRDYKSFVAKLSEEAPKLDTLDLAIRLEFGSSSLTDLLICAVFKKADLSKIVNIVKTKLELLTDDQIMDIWSRIQKEFSPDRTFSMKADLDVLPPDWLKTGNIKDTSNKIAEYTVILKVRLMLTMFEIEEFTVPSESPTLAQILSLSASAAATPISQIELELSRGLARLYIYWSRILTKPSREFLNVLSLPRQGSFVDKREHQGSVFGEAFTGSDSERLILFELKKVIRASYSFARHETPVEKALMQYKLGREVMAPEIIEEFKNKKELLLQKELCKFLLERNIFSFGTKFVRSETDLLAELPTEGFIIETKIYKEGKRVNEKVTLCNYKATWIRALFTEEAYLLFTTFLQYS